MSRAVDSIRSVVPAATHAEDDPLDPLVRIVRGRTIQLSGLAALSVAVALLARVQRTSQRPVAWVTDGPTIPFAPDCVDAGVDLARLAVVRTGEGPRATRAVDILLRSSEFDLVVLDVHGRPPEAGIASRFMHLCRRTSTGLVYVTPLSDSALAATIAVHLHTTPYYDEGQRVHLTPYRNRHELRDAICRAVGPAGLH